MSYDTSGFVFDKYIEVADGHHATAKQKGKLQIKMCGNNRDTFVATLHNVLWNQIYAIIILIITSIDLGHTCLFHKGFCTLYFRDREKNAVNLPSSAQKKHTFWGLIKKMTK